MAWFAVLVFLVLIAVVAVGKKQAKFGATGAATTVLEVDGIGARRELADGRLEQIDWSDLTRVEVVHARRGPHAEAGGVVMLAGDEANGCLVPMNRIGDTMLLDQLTRLPGFDVEGFVRALQDTKQQEIVCWLRSGTLEDPPNSAP